MDDLVGSMIDPDFYTGETLRRYANLGIPIRKEREKIGERLRSSN